MKRNLLLGSLAGIMAMSCGSTEVTEKINVDEIVNEVKEEIKEEVKEVVGSDLFSHEDGQFVIKFMGTPQEDSQTVPTDVGDIQMTTLMHEESVTEAYMVAYADYPSGMIEATDAKTLLEGGKEGAASSLGVTEYSEEKDIKMHGYPGLHFKAHNANGTYVVYDIYLVKNRLYQVAILRDGSYPTQKHIDDFNGTFDFAYGVEESKE